MQFKKKQWVKPAVVPLSLAQARARMLAAVELLEEDGEFPEECAELRSLITAIDDELGEADELSR